jgi:hypothetical protein
MTCNHGFDPPLRQLIQAHDTKPLQFFIRHVSSMIKDAIKKAGEAGLRCQAFSLALLRKDR